MPQVEKVTKSDNFCIRINKISFVTQKQSTCLLVFLLLLINIFNTQSFVSVIPPLGCQACTKSEINYCLSRDLINDHCCCDKRYQG